MWNYQLYANNKEILKKFGKYSLIAGIIFTIIGILAIVYPFYAALATAAFVSWMMVLAGVIAGYFTFITDPKDWWGWLKAFILIAIGLLILFYPISGVETVGLLLAIYLLMDGFSSFALASLRKPAKGWWLWILNGIISIALAIIFLITWPFVPTQMWLVGMYVGISLLVDGLVLVFLGVGAEKAAHNEES
jgi:uncharacterized membrane protein HdeD (DUF308 family)